MALTGITRREAIAAGAGAARLRGEWRRFLDAVVAMRYSLLVTELDVRDNHLPPTSAHATGRWRTMRAAIWT